MFEGKSPEQTSAQPMGYHRRKSNRSAAKELSRFVDRTFRYRYEMKYHISESKAVAMSQFIKPYLDLDRYSKLQPGGSYPIVSLYLDSGNLQLCRESMTGQKNRYKLRIRSYSDDQNYPSFFEIKRRINNVILKSRAPVRHQDIVTLLSGLPLPTQEYTSDKEALNQFQLYMNSINAKPAILIRYMRQAYESESENRVRVTFDRELAFNVTSEPEVKLNGRGWQRHSLTLGGVILEIKFTGCYPAWLNRMVEYFDLRRGSISKYATSIKQSWSLGFCGPKLSR